MTEVLDNLLKLVKDKKVFLGTHYDADGICSGSLIYHLIKDHAASIETVSKGTVFRIDPEDIKGNPDVIICTDIKPSEELDCKNKVIYIDHHPMIEGSTNEDEFLMCIFDKDSQSCSLMIWEKLIPETNNPYFVFLTLLGYFGDGGDHNNIPVELQMKAKELLKIPTRYGTHDLMELKQSRYSPEGYLEIQKFVSPLNTGKRMHWSGDIPFELMKNIDDMKPFIYNYHPIAEQLQEYKRELRNFYEMEIHVHDTEKVQYAVIECDKNVQGVLCARHMKDKPLIVINRHGDDVIASMRVPDDVEFDAGAFLAEFNGKIPDLTGGGHEKAGGVTFNAEHLDKFLELMREE